MTTYSVVQFEGLAGYLLLSSIPQQITHSLITTKGGLRICDLCQEHRLRASHTLTAAQLSE